MNVDLLVIGGGSGGYAAVRTAADGGASCALVESAETLGGLCILRGCMPSKALIESANRCRDLREAAEFGLVLPQPPHVDWQRVQDRKRSLIDGFRQYRHDQLTGGDFALLRGQARFLASDRVEVENNEGTTLVQARRVIVATGSETDTPEIEGLDSVHAHTSDSLLELDDLPRRLVVIGGGSVGLEFAHCFEGFGSEVTIVQRSERLLGSFEPEVSAHLLAASRERGIEVLLNHDVAEVRPRGNETEAVLRDHEGNTASRTGTLLLATGRHPCTTGLALDAAGIKPTGDGRIRIDRQCRTSNPAVFAAGDCASPFPVVHLAVIQGEVAAANALVDLELADPATVREWNPAHQMAGIFTHPEAVQIGITTDEARELGEETVAASVPFREGGRAAIRGCRHGFVKLVARRDNGRLIGASAVSDLAVELSQGVMVAIHQCLDAATFAQVPHYHPTLVELWLDPAEELAKEGGRGETAPTRGCAES